MAGQLRFTVERFSVEDWRSRLGDSPNVVLVSISDGIVPNSFEIAKSFHYEKPVTSIIDAEDALTDKLGLHVLLGQRGEHCKITVTGEVCANVRELMDHTDGKEDSFSYAITGPDGETMGLLNFHCEWKLLDPNDPAQKHSAGISAMDPTHIHPGGNVLLPTPPPNPEPPARRPGFLKRFGTRVLSAFAVNSFMDGVDSIKDDIDPDFS